METKIIERNIERLFGSDKGELGYLKWKESMGGNAGCWGNNPCTPCIAANFFYDEKNGFIVYFENLQSVPQSIRDRFKQGTLRLAFNMKNGVEKIVDLHATGLTPKAKENLIGAIIAYNRAKAVPRVA